MVLEMFIVIYILLSFFWEWNLCFYVFKCDPCCRKGDYYRYLAEFKGANDRKEAADQSLKAYEVCLICSSAESPHFSLFHPFVLPL